MLEAPRRRTQAERREGTRRALLSATIQSLVEIGYTRTSTTEVVKRAGVSQGALFKHFPSKSALVAAATEQLFDDLFASFERAFAKAGKDDEPIVAAVRGLWRIFCTPELQVVYRLYTEATSDPELLAALRPVVVQHEKRLSEFAAGLFPEIARAQENRVLFEGIVFAMQGMSLQRPVYVPKRAERDLLASIEAVARTLSPRSPSSSPLMSPLSPLASRSPS